MRGYALAMSHTTPLSTVAHAINLSFVMRLTGDSLTGNWRIVLKPINGEETRHFSDVEAALLYLEGLMTDLLQQGNR